jgi:hypothetical protein
MVQGIPRLRARLNKFAAELEAEIERAVAESANEIVAQMRAIRPDPSIVIGWTWGAAPAGAIAIGETNATNSDGIRATIFATGPMLQDARVPITLARVFEFGTEVRTQRTTGRRTGVMPARPYFFPVYRANRSRARGRISRAVRKAAQKS